MADASKIEWTDATWNIINGCSVVSPGCTNCYAMRLAGTRLRHHGSREGLTQDTKAGPVWTGDVRWWEPFYRQPLQWTRPRRIFVCAHGDLFHPAVPNDWIDRIMAMAALCPQHTFQILTKRALRMRLYFDGDWQRRALAALGRMRKEPNPPMLSRHVAASYCFENGKPLPNVHAGVSAEDQTRADERVPELLRAHVAVRWVSAEPLLAPLDLSRWMGYLVRPDMGFVEHGERELLVPYPRLDWVEVGGESGPGARPMHPDWVRNIRDDCAVAGVAFGFKQHGEWIGVPDLRRLPDGGGPGFGAYDHCAYDQKHEAVRVGKHTAGRMLDGRTHDGLREART